MTNLFVEELKRRIGIEGLQNPSPYGSWLSPTVVGVEDGSLRFRYKVRKDMTNLMGIIHAGVMAGIASDIMGATCFTLGEDVFYSTINLQLDCFSIAQEGSAIIAVSKLLRKGMQVVHLECNIWNEDETKLLAKASSNLMKVNF